MQSSHPRFEMLARHRAQFLVTLLIGVCLGSPGAWASSGGGLPWEAPLEQIQQSITGPVAGFIALSAVAVAGGMLIFGGELNDFARRLMYVVLVAGILLGASQIVGLFGATGASLASSSSGPDEESLAQQRSAVTDTVTLTQSVPNQPHQAGRVV